MFHVQRKKICRILKSSISFSLDFSIEIILSFNNEKLKLIFAPTNFILSYSKTQKRFENNISTPRTVKLENIARFNLR